MTRVRIGTVSDARDRFGFLDGAEAWEAISAGRHGLSVVRGEDPDNPDRWTVYQDVDDDESP